MNDNFYSLNLFDHDEDEQDGVNPELNCPMECESPSSSQPVIRNFCEAIDFLSRPIEIDDGEDVLINYENIISTYLGNMTQCRVYNKEVDRLGGIKYLVNILHTLIDRSCKGSSEWWSNKESELNLANVTLGALRDLACGHASNRLQIGKFKLETSQETFACIQSHLKYKRHSITAKNLNSKQIFVVSGLDITSYFVNTYAKKKWEQIPKMLLRNMTNALGVMRNITHSTAYNCKALHDIGMTTALANRILGIASLGDDACYSSLPDASKPWREASYRIAGTLINMAEKCKEVAFECALNEDLILILIDSWGGLNQDYSGSKKSKNKAIPCLHLGLKAVLIEKLKLENCQNGDENSENDSTGIKESLIVEREKEFSLNHMIQHIMEREDQRKRAAQERENSRKKI